MQCYSTAAVSRGTRLSYWNDLNSNVFSPVEFTPAQRADFNAEIRIDHLGPLMISLHFSAPATIDHTAAHVALSTERRVALFMPTQGEVKISHYGRDEVLREGDFVLVDPFAPTRLVFDGAILSLGLGIPYDVLTIEMPDPEPTFGRAIHRDRGLGSLVGSMLHGVWSEVERGLSPEFRPAVAKSLMEMIATACAVEHGSTVEASSQVASRRAQIKRYIETHLRDPNLCPATIASAHGLSTRYIRAIFESERESLSSYILRRRLEECARQLSSTLWRGRSITDTAFEWGFSSMAHFARVFKTRYGMTPRDFRIANRRAIPSG